MKWQHNIFGWHITTLLWLCKKGTWELLAKLSQFKLLDFSHAQNSFRPAFVPLILRAKVWGHRSYPQNEDIHNWAVWYLWRGLKHAALSAVTWDVERRPCEVWWKVCTVGLWNRFIMRKIILSKLIWNLNGANNRMGHRYWTCIWIFLYIGEKWRVCFFFCFACFLKKIMIRLLLFSTI